MFKNYTISITQNEEPNTVPYSAYCKEWDIIADDSSIPEALSALFPAIKILEEDDSDRKPISIKKEINFRIPIAA